MALGSVVKAVARQRVDEAQIEVCAAAANVFSRGAWSASRTTRLPPPQIVASKDVIDLSGLQLIEWDGSTHSNIPIAAHEHRSSIAFFMSSGLGRWYQNDYMSDKGFKAQATGKQLQAWKDQRSRLWVVGLELLQC
ncbi:hypothetical protein F5880DRAFT_1312762 [Lentinula raphanica]|nr:hypothetical protein F5880DRAFT_1312762 [Lentinula raphanica]